MIESMSLSMSCCLSLQVPHSEKSDSSTSACLGWSVRITISPLYPKKESSLLSIDSSYGSHLFESGDKKIEGKCSTFSIYSVVKARVWKIENIPDNLRSILNPEYFSKREWSSILGSLTCILCVSFNIKPYSRRINRGKRLWAIYGTHKAFLIIKRRVYPDLGQSYAITASTIGTFGIPPASSENTFTFSYWPVWLNTKDCFPSTIMLAW